MLLCTRFSRSAVVGRLHHSYLYSKLVPKCPQLNCNVFHTLTNSSQNFPKMFEHECAVVDSYLILAYDCRPFQMNKGLASVHRRASLIKLCQLNSMWVGKFPVFIRIEINHLLRVDEESRSLTIEGGS